MAQLGNLLCSPIPRPQITLYVDLVDATGVRGYLAPMQVNKIH